MTPAPTTSYATGGGTAIAGPEVIALIDARYDHPIVVALVGPIIEGATFGDVVAQITSAGPVQALPSLGVATLDGDTQILVRGAVTATTTLSEASHRSLDGRSVTTWREESVPGAVAIELALDDAGSDILPAPGAGTAPASRILRSLQPSGAASPSQAGGPPSEPSPVAPPQVVAAASPPGASSPPGPPPAATAPPPPPTAQPVDDDFDFGHLLGHTQHRTVEDAAVRPAEDAGSPPPVGPPPEVTPPPPAPPGSAPIADVPQARPEPRRDETLHFSDDDSPIAGTPGLISSVPGLTSPSSPAQPPAPAATPPAPPAAPPPSAPPAPAAAPATRLIPEPPPSMPVASPSPPPPPPVAPSPAPPSASLPVTLRPEVSSAEGDDDLDIATRRRPPTPDLPPPPAVPNVQAVHCPRGHPNPPHASQCRECGDDITDRDVRLVARPPLGRLVFSSGASLELNRPLLLGRKPPANAMIEGEPAASVAIKDPDKLLSRVHAEIRLVDWQVQVVDRDSMNHTYVEIPGHAPMQLRPADPHPIPPGSVVNLADAVRLTYEVEASPDR